MFFINAHTTFSFILRIEMLFRARGPAPSVRRDNNNRLTISCTENCPPNRERAFDLEWDAIMNVLLSFSYCRRQRNKIIISANTTICCCAHAVISHLCVPYLILCVDTFIRDGRDDAEFMVYTFSFASTITSNWSNKIVWNVFVEPDRNRLNEIDSNQF